MSTSHQDDVIADYSNSELVRQYVLCYERALRVDKHIFDNTEGMLEFWHIVAGINFRRGNAILDELNLRMQTATEDELPELLALLEKHSPVIATAGLEARRA